MDRIYIKLFDTHSEYETYKNGQDFITPNVSYCINANDVHYNPWLDSRLIIKYYSDTNNIELYEGKSLPGEGIYSKIEIDNVEVSVSTIDANYGNYQTATTGEHTVKYTLINPTLIEQDAFNNMHITSVIIPNTVTTIGSQAFYSCPELTSITIPDSVTSIGQGAFKGCRNLSIITVDSNNTIYDSRNRCNAIIQTSNNTLIQGCKNTIIPNTVTTIGQDAFRNCNDLTSLTIPNSVTTIGESAFYGCDGLTSIGSVGSGASLEIPSSVTSINNSVFYGCIYLTSVTIPNSVTSIGTYAFYNCTHLTSVTIGSGVTSIGNNAFNNCRNIASVTVEATTPPTYGTNAFSPYEFNGWIYVPASSVNTYKTTSGWSSKSASIKAIPTT